MHIAQLAFHSPAGATDAGALVQEMPARSVPKKVDCRLTLSLFRRSRLPTNTVRWNRVCVLRGYVNPDELLCGVLLETNVAKSYGTALAMVLQSDESFRAAHFCVPIDERGKMDAVDLLDELVTFGD